jgi:hypothetical protein
MILRAECLEMRKSGIRPERAGWGPESVVEMRAGSYLIRGNLPVSRKWPN